MNSIWWQVAGWTMIHFLWIGSLLFLVIALVRLVLFRAAPQWRYAASLLGLAVLAVSPPLIALRIAREIKPLVVDVEPIAPVVEGRYDAPLVAASSAASTLEVDPPAPAVIDLKYTPITVEALSIESPLEASPAEMVVESQPVAPPVQASAESIFHPQLLLQTLPSYLPWLWMIGTPATLLLLATGLMGSERLRRRAEPITDPVLLETLGKLTAALRIGRRVSLAVSDRVLQPVLVGIVRPLVLLPSVALTSWSPDEIEMALVHELAHVRRWDNLVNLVQRLVESLLFFHPAVWITSRWVRADREHCCDAVVVAHCGNREAYASLLVSVAKSSVTRRLPSPAMAMASHPLAKRVRRILQLEDDPMLVSKRTLLSVAVLLAALTAGAVWSSTLAEETKGEPEASAPGVDAVGTLEVEELSTEGTESRKNLEASESFYMGLEATLNSKGEPAASALGGKEVTIEGTEDAEKEESIILHPELTDAELADIRTKLKAANSGYTISIDGPFVFLRSNDGLVKARRIEIQGKKWQLRGPASEMDLEDGFAILLAEFHDIEWSAAKEQFAALRDELTDYTIHATSSPVKFFVTKKKLDPYGTKFDGPSKVYDSNDSVPEEAVRMLVAAHEQAGNVVNIRRGEGTRYQIVVTKSNVASDKPGEPEASATGVEEETTESTEDAEKELIVDTTFSGTETTKTYDYDDGTPFAKIKTVIEKFEKAGHKVYLARKAGQLSVVVTKGDKSPATAATTNKLPFLSLDDQRIADLAYGMLGVEVAAIDAEELAAVKEKGFAGGVKIERLGGVAAGGWGGPRQGPSDPSEWRSGDILVGLHIWPTANFSELADVLRRGDLNQFVPLKYFVLRYGPVEKLVQSDLGNWEQRIDTKASTQWHLHTGRIAFDTRKWSEEQQRLKQIELKAERDAGETTLLPLPGQPGAVKVGPAEAPAAVAAEPEITPPIATTPIAEPAEAEPIKPAPPQLLYDGRTFDDWRTEWKTELKTENRTEAIKALRAFGRAGYGKEATEAILEVAEEYPMTSIGGDNSPQNRLQTAIAYSFADVDDSSPIPSDVAIPVILDWYDKGDANRVRLAKWVLSTTFSKDSAVLERVAALGAEPEMAIDVVAHLLRSDPSIENELTQQMLNRCFESQDANIIVNTLVQLLPARLVAGGGGGFTAEHELRQLPASLPSLLFHKDQRVRQYARWALKHATPDQLGNLPEVLMGIAEQPGEGASFGDVTVVEKNDDAKVQKARRFDALRALAAIGTNAEAMGERIVTLYEKADDDTQVFGALALQRIYASRQPSGVGGIPQSLYDRIKATRDSRPKFESKFDTTKESSALFPQDQLSGGGGFRGDMGGGGMF